ncbi:MAG TPA: hypothetical protein VFL55_01455 [Acetobacteraceae bacterium]|nr:hypothetical protein [Acetobacteraceae bacterium]
MTHGHSRNSDGPIGQSYWNDILLIVTLGMVVNILLIAVPGYYSHDELDWQNRIARHEYPWSFGLGSITQSNFLRPLGAIIISLSLRLPLQPVAAHLTEVMMCIASACLLYKAVALFRPDRALAAAILFMLMPGFAYAAGWVAAGFDAQFTFLGICSVFSAVIYWRGGRWIFLLLSLSTFAAALCCKETALSIPICAALVMYMDRHRIDPRRAAILVAVVAGLCGLYLAVNITRFLRVANSESGGYGFGSGRQMLHNALAYFTFPFATEATEIGLVPMQSGRRIFLLSLLHLVLLGSIFWRGGAKWVVIYLVGFYATLLPVLPISKYETQYAYASSIALASALAIAWDWRLVVAIPLTLSVLILGAHTLAVQRSMYETGVCQTRALETLTSVLPQVRKGDHLAVFVTDNTPWWVLARAVNDNSFPLRGQLATVSITRDPAAASMTFHKDCRVAVGQ